MAGGNIVNSTNLALVFSSVLLYLIVKSIYNAFLHPLRSFPGPKLWRTSYIFRHVSAMRGQLDWSIKAFHDQYGPVVRISPTELSFNTEQAWKDIYGHKASPMVKDLQWYGVASQAHSIFNSNHQMHARIKKQLSHAFSEKALREQEPIILGYIDLLVKKMKNKARDGLPLDLTQWYNFMTFDLVGDLALGQDFGCLDSERSHDWINNLFNAIKIGPFMRAMATYTDVRRVMRWLAPKSIVQARVKHESYVKNHVQERLDKGVLDERRDFISYILKNREGKHDFTNDEIAANCGFLLLAGSETTATLMSGLTYQLVKNPRVMKKVTEEIRGAFKSEDEIDFTNSTARLPYTQACIDEALRKYPPAPNLFPRVAGRADGTVIDGYRVPSVATVGVHALSASLSSANFKDPDAFVPERWLACDDDDQQTAFRTDKRGASQPFSIGPYGCLGKSMAKNQLRAMVARLLWNFDLELCDASDGWDRQLTYTFWEKKPLLCNVSTVA